MMLSSHLQIVMLPLLFSFEVQSCKPSQVLLADGFVDGGTAADTLAVVVRRISPPIRLHFHIAENHVLYWCGQARHLWKYFSVSKEVKLLNLAVFINWTIA